MPELPEVEALADHLRRHATGATIGRIDISALSVLKTFDPPITALHGQPVTGATRWGKYLGLQAGDLYLVTHLSRAGWLRWSDKLAAAPSSRERAPSRCGCTSEHLVMRQDSISRRPAPKNGWPCGWCEIPPRCRR